MKNLLKARRATHACCSSAVAALTLLTAGPAAAQVVVDASHAAAPAAVSDGTGLVGRFVSFSGSAADLDDALAKEPVDSWSAVVNVLNFTEPGDVYPYDNDPLDLFVRFPYDFVRLPDHKTAPSQDSPTTPSTDPHRRTRCPSPPDATTSR